MQNCPHAFSVCANGLSLSPMKNDPGAHATESSNPALNATPFDTSKRTLTERHYPHRGAFVFSGPASRASAPAARHRGRSMSLRLRMCGEPLLHERDFL